MRYPELSKLPKATGFKSVNFRRQTPGSLSNLLSPAPSKRNILDPTHPAANASFASFPSFRSNEFGIRAYPMALLDKPDVLWQAQWCPFDSWKDRVDRAKRANAAAGSTVNSQTVAPMLLNNYKPYRISMSYLGVNTKTRTGGKRHIRKEIVKKIKTSINLIIVRGADVTELKGRPALVFNQHQGEHDQTQWVLQGWTYVFFPTLEIYRMSYHDLIPKMRSALHFVTTKGLAMEKRWTAQLSLHNITNALSAQGRHSRTDKRGNAVHRTNAPTNRIPRKTIALHSPKKARVASQGWRTALDMEADTEDEGWKFDIDEDGSGYDDRKDVNIDIKDDHSTPANSDRKVTEPLLSFPSLQRSNNRDLQWPLLPTGTTPTGQESWHFSDAPPTATEAEDAWANKYPVSVREMARRKLFRSQAVFRPSLEPKRTDNKE